MAGKKGRNMFIGENSFFIRSECISKSASEHTTILALVRYKTSPWKINNTVSTPVCLGEFSQLTKPQQVTLQPHGDILNPDDIEVWTTCYKFPNIR